MKKKIVLHDLGYYTLEDKPTNKELEEYYESKYFQNEKGSYSQSYSNEELKYFFNKIEQKFLIIEEALKGSDSKTRKTFLDIGAGEGFALKFFHEKGWDVMGLDFSNFGCQSINPEMLKYLTVGDIYKRIDDLINENKKFNVLWLVNVLEHVVDPLGLVLECKKLMETNGVLVIEVPNDFSSLQMELLSMGKIEDEFWVITPDHLSYFGVEGLENLMKKAGWLTHDIITDFPIDFALFNPDTNYVMDKTKGRNVHLSRVLIENHMHELSASKANDLYRSLAHLGLGRQINGFFKVDE